MSLDSPAEALQSSAATEANFERLHELGAFNADGKPDAEQASPEVARTDIAPEAAPADPAASGQADEGPEYSNLDEFLTKQNLERDSFYDLPVTVKVDGKTSLVKLSDVVKSYQLEQHVNGKSIALSEASRALEAERTQAQAAIAQQFQAATALGNLANQQLMSEFNQIDWKALHDQDPGRWSALQLQFNQRAGAIQQHMSQVQQAAQQAQAQAEQERQQTLSTKVLPQERERMLEARPEWRDDTKFQEARSQMSTFAKSLGFTDAELSQVHDHRYMLALDMAARYAALQASAPNAVKRVRTAPISAQPGARTSRDPNSVAYQRDKEAARKNPRDQDAQARLFSRFA